jgi:hypothetical protein
MIQLKQRFPHHLGSLGISADHEDLAWAGMGALGQIAGQFGDAGGDTRPVLAAKESSPGGLGLEHVPPSANGWVSSTAV